MSNCNLCLLSPRKAAFVCLSRRICIEWQLKHVKEETKWARIRNTDFKTIASDAAMAAICMNQCAAVPCFLASVVRAMWWQLSVQHGERLTHFLSVFSPSGRELIKKGLWFYLLSAPGPCVCVSLCECVRARLILPYLRPFSVTPV